MSRLVVFCIGLMIALPAARADAYEDCVQEQDRDRAILGCTEIITKGHEIEQDDLSLAYYNRGLAYNQKGDPDRAIADFNKAIELNPNFAVAYGMRGVAYDHKGDPDRAIADYSKAIELDPNLALFYGERGIDYNQTGDPDRAIADFNKVIELNPNFAPAYGARGSAYETKGDPDRAIADYRKATELGFAPSKERLKQLGASP